MATNSSKRTHAVYISSDDDSNTRSNVAPSSKRARQVSDPALWTTISSLPAAKAKSLLYTLLLQNPELRTHIQDAEREVLAEKAAKEAAKPPVDFQGYPTSCWRALNTRYKCVKSSQQYMAAGDVSNELDDARMVIMKQAGKGTRWETRRNALEVLRKISKSVMMCDVQVIRHEIMKDGMLLSQFADSMLNLAKGMSAQERQWYKDEGLYETLVALQELYDDVSMEGLQKVYAVFDRDEVMDDEDGDEEGSEDDVPDDIDSEEERRLDAAENGYIIDRRY
ncbi:hypothetical protein BDZ45DRAFT_488303 [Acephala macrosclerotiorum]|nr:hypothetical protein BDZ45DRAFT_488303 [Acephala macrosclerotiorum]